MGEVTMTKRKSLVSIFLTFAMLLSMIPFSSAANNKPIATETLDLGDGFTVDITTTVISTSQARATSHSQVAQKTVTANYRGKEIGEFVLSGSFTYNGSSAKAVSDDWTAAAASGYDYDGQSSHSGATVKGSCTFSGNGINKTVSLKITCDKDGNLS